MDSYTTAQWTKDQVLIDTGAEVTVISEHTHDAISKPPLSPPPWSLKGPSNHALPVTGHFSGTIKLGAQEAHQDVYVVKRLHQQLLGRPAIKVLGVVVRAGAISTFKAKSQSVPNCSKAWGSSTNPTQSNFAEMPSHSS